jgi:hypothetical protein
MVDDLKSLLLAILESHVEPCATLLDLQKAVIAFNRDCWTHLSAGEQPQQITLGDVKVRAEELLIEERHIASALPKHLSEICAGAQFSDPKLN